MQKNRGHPLDGKPYQPYNTVKPYYSDNTVWDLKRKGAEAVVSFDQFVLQDGVPLYLQIVRYLQRGLVSGAIPPGAELPSRRVLSALLGVNPNTVQKAYRLLEDSGVIASHTGAKSFVCAGEDTIARIRAQLLESDVKSAVEALRQSGLSKSEALALVERFWDQPSGKEQV